jgi:choice-of-anchor C domain-containing protein
MIVAAVAAFGLHATSGADMIANGSFETGPSMPTGTMMLANGSTAVTGWVVSSGDVDYYDVTFWETEDGSRSVGLNGDQPGAIAQSFATSPGTAYTVSFWMAGEPFTDPVIKHIRVSAAGQSADYSFDSGPAWHWSMGWVHHTFNFAAQGTTSTLVFQSLDAGTDSPVIDNVQVGPAAATVDDRPAGLWLAAPRPNPIHGRTGFDYSLPADGRATLVVVDLAGRTVATLADGWHAAGAHHVTWDPRHAAGIYFLRLATAAGERTTRFTLLP